MALNAIEEVRLQTRMKAWGRCESADEALQIAIESEKTCQDIGPFDMAYEHFKATQLAFEEIAYLIEKKGGV